MHSKEEKAGHKRIEEALKKTFRPEFINRIDEIIIFEPLSEEHVIEIVSLQMKEVQARLAEHGGLTIEMLKMIKSSSSAWKQHLTLKIYMRNR